MALEVYHRRFYCTTSEVSFGPQFESEEEGDKFRSWMYQHHGDARKFLHEELETWLEEFRCGAGRREGNDG